MRKCAVIAFLLMLAAGVFVLPAAMQSTCSMSTRLAVGQRGRVAFTDGSPLNVRESTSRNSAVVGKLPEGTSFDILEGPACAEDINWWRVQSGDTAGWIAEAADGVYLVEPQVAPLPTGTPVALSQGVPFSVWDWAAFVGDNNNSSVADPMTITPPAVYAGSLPALPVDLNGVLFVGDAGLSDARRGLLAQNGFVVVPAGLKQFDEGYNEFDEGWYTVADTFDYEVDLADQVPGHPIFVTTDSMLHALHYIFDNLLTDLEREVLIRRVQTMAVNSLNAAAAQYQEARGTALETPARSAVLYLLVAMRLLEAESGVPDGVDESIVSEADALIAAAMAGEGQLPVSFLPGYLEDFSQYRPRGHYTGESRLESYFRGMMWLSRLTFRANDDTETLTALMLLRALSHPAAMTEWQAVHDTLTFLIGPVDDLGPTEYRPLADELFGADMALANLADPAKLAVFRERLAALPGPRVNGLVLPADTGAEEVAELTRGFRLMGQRFTFDGYMLQQLMSPYVGTPGNIRPLPLALDVAASMGSDTAYTLAAEAGATGFEKYDTQLAMLRGQIGSLTRDNWLENTYSGWLWTLQPLWARDPASYPPLMNTEAWRRKDVQTGLASWTELKHDTVLYAKQPTGFGGGGPPLGSYGYVEPNPLVFARISAVAALTVQGLTERGLLETNEAMSEDAITGVLTATGELRHLAFKSAEFAVMARKELAGEPLTESEYFRIQTHGTYLNILLRTLYQGEGEPDPVALVTDVASNTTMNTVLQEGVGGVDYIYVVIPLPDGRLQTARGAVFSYYEFVGDINQRMTDEEWRTIVANGQLPPRPSWVSAFVGE